MERASLLTEIVVRVIREFHLDLSEIHTDSTTVTFSGVYREADGPGAMATGQVDRGDHLREE